MANARLIKALELKAAKLCPDVVRMCTEAGSGHPSSGLSLVHMVTALMYQQMRYDPANPWNLASDRLVLSEGHAVPVVYAAYADLNGVAGKSKKDSFKLKREDLWTLRELDSVLDGHPNPAEGMPFFDAATGSLGQGPSVSAGLALAARADKLDKNIYCIVGDGESREGQVWEAMDFIAEHNLTNVITIFNCNKQGQSDYVAPQQKPEVIGSKLAALGMNALIIDGHDIRQILNTLEKNVGKKKPLAIVMETVKGWGSSVLTSGNWHGKPLPAGDLEKTYKDFDKIIAKLEKSGAKLDKRMLKPSKPKKTVSMPKLKEVSFKDIFKILSSDSKFKDSEKIATRRAYGHSLVELGKLNKNVVALDADVKNSTFSILFHDKYPDRFYECRIAEQNMLSVAVGLAAGGKIPFVSTFGKFLVRAYDQIEMAAIGRANIKICGSHSGITLGADGPSQMSMTDVAYFGSMSTAHSGDGTPVCVVLQPTDGVAAAKMVELMANHKGMCYMRTLRSDTPRINQKNATFNIGGVRRIVKGKDVAIFASAHMVHVAIEAAEILKSKGVKASVIDAYCLPINESEVLAAAKENKKTIVTLEDNYGHGMGAAVAQIAAEKGNIRVHSITLPWLPKSAKDGDEMLKAMKLDADSVAARIKKFV